MVGPVEEIERRKLDEDAALALAGKLRALGVKSFNYHPGYLLQVEFSDEAIRLGLHDEMKAVSRAGDAEAGQLQRDAKIDEAERAQRDMEEELASA